ncbi:TlyA family RNA methyltransferase [Candidatus Auribacterota bacterium]
MGKKKRLDIHLVDNGLTPSREQAKRLILAGKVYVNKRIIDKPAAEIENTDIIELKGKQPFVSRGGSKLKKALEEFSISVDGLTAADIGASTGGFTDCLLQSGARRVFSIDVGKGLIDWNLRNDPRVEVMESCNARYLKEGDLKEKPDIVTVDVSFISLEKILPALKEVIKDGGKCIVLIKPQFEAERKEMKKGVVRDPEVHKRVIAKIDSAAKDNGFDVAGVTESPIKGPAGNVEFLMFMRKPKSGKL